MPIFGACSRKVPQKVLTTFSFLGAKRMAHLVRLTAVNTCLVVAARPQSALGRTTSLKRKRNSLKVKAVSDFKSNIDIFNLEIVSAVLKLNMLLRIFRGHSNILLSKVPDVILSIRQRQQQNAVLASYVIWACFVKCEN